MGNVLVQTTALGIDVRRKLGRRLISMLPHLPIFGLIEQEQLAGKAEIGELAVDDGYLTVCQ